LPTPPPAAAAAPPCASTAASSAAASATRIVACSERCSGSLWFPRCLLESMSAAREPTAGDAFAAVVAGISGGSARSRFVAVGGSDEEARDPEDGELNRPRREVEDGKPNRPQLVRDVDARERLASAPPGPSSSSENIRRRPKRAQRREPMFNRARFARGSLTTPFGPTGPNSGSPRPSLHRPDRGVSPYP
jgi:hypothetical protein